MKMKNPWLNWHVYKSIAGLSSRCGELCSLRFTWQRPKKNASGETEFLEVSLVQYLHLAQELAGSPLVELYINKRSGANNLFALAEFENQVVAEFEMNETMPDTIPDTFFIKANFTGGHVTNQPLAAYFNEPGSILASDDELQQFTVFADTPVTGGIVETLMARCEVLGTPEMNGGEKLLEAVRKAVQR